MRLLDLFCGEGGAAAGYVAAGFEVHGVDVEAKLRARYLASGASSFTVGDAAEYPFDGFDVVHASPPCQDHSVTRSFSGPARGTGWLLGHMLDRLAGWDGGLWVVENVQGAAPHMPGSLVLCGSEFGLGAQGRVLRRHRLFLSNVWLWGAGWLLLPGPPDRRGVRERWRCRRRSPRRTPGSSGSSWPRCWPCSAWCDPHHGVNIRKMACRYLRDTPSSWRLSPVPRRPGYQPSVAPNGRSQRRAEVIMMVPAEGPPRCGDTPPRGCDVFHCAGTARGGDAPDR